MTDLAEAIAIVDAYNQACKDADEFMAEFHRKRTELIDRFEQDNQQARIDVFARRKDAQKRVAALLEDMGLTGFSFGRT